VIALSTVRIGTIGRAVFVAVEKPAQVLVTVAPVPRRDGRTCIVTATHDDAGAFAIQVSYAGQIPVGAIAGRIAPEILQCLRLELRRAVEACGYVAGGGEFCAAQTIKYREIFGPLRM